MEVVMRQERGEGLWLGGHPGTSAVGLEVEN